MKFAAVVILYNPDEKVLQNILSYAQFADVVYVYDNSENPVESIVVAIKQLQNIFYFSDCENRGIAYRLNQAADNAISEGYEWLLTMDQDSMFQVPNLSHYLQLVNQYKEKELVAMFGVEFEKAKLTIAQENALSKEYVITSGSFLNLNLFPFIGPFDEALFIDEVDLEYCYRAINKGFKIIQFADVFLNHHLGTVAMFRSFKNGQLTPRTLHSPLRVYYMIRNFLYVDDLYKNQFSVSTAIRKKTLFNRFKNNFLYGNNKWNLVKMVYRAIVDYKKGKMGKFK